MSAKLVNFHKPKLTKFPKKLTLNSLTGYFFLFSSRRNKINLFLCLVQKYLVHYHAISTTKRGREFNLWNIIAIQIEILIRTIVVFLNSLSLNVSITCSTREKRREAGLCTTLYVYSSESTLTTSGLKLPEKLSYFHFILSNFYSTYLLKAFTPFWIRTTSI